MERLIKRLLIVPLTVIVCVITLNYISNSAIMYGDVTGGSMNPTFYEGDCLAYTPYTSYNINDIVVSEPSNYDGKIVKRIVGLPNSTITIIDDILYVDDIKVKDMTGSLVHIVYYNKTLQEDEYFLLGDNYSNSIDSRTLGPINKQCIVGKVIGTANEEQISNNSFTPISEGY